MSLARARGVLKKSSRGGSADDELFHFAPFLDLSFCSSFLEIPKVAGIPTYTERATATPFLATFFYSNTGRAAGNTRDLPQTYMVEGHGVHRTAAAARKKLKGKRFKATSPNSRFTEGAKAIDGKILSRVEAIGKNLFYFFGEGEELVVVHIHFGMAGRCRISGFPGPSATATTRLELRNEQDTIIAHVSAMTVQYAGIELYEKKYSALGPDPLREDADAERLWRSLRKSKKSVGQVLMAQELVQNNVNENDFT